MLAIVGGIGAGKTYASNIFEKFGVPVFNTDNSAKELMNKDPRIISEFCSIFGHGIYKGGKLDRKALGNIIFSDKEKFEQLEAIVHPSVLKEFMDWKYEKIYKEHYPFVIMENAILTNGKTYKLFDFVIMVDAKLDIRKQRIMQRPEMTEEKMNMVIEQQDDPEFVYSKLLKEKIFVYTITNDGDCDLEDQVKDIINFYKTYFQQSTTHPQQN